MKVIVFGATGKVGRLVVAELLRRNHKVTAFVHKSRLDEQPNLRQIQGDIYNRDQVTVALAGHNVIVSTLGSWGTKDKNVLSSAMQRIVPASEATGVKRIISLTGSAAGAPGDKTGLGTKLSRLALGLGAPKILRDGEDHIVILANSSLNWTVVRAGGMTNANHETYKLDGRKGSATIPRLAVAEAMADLAENDEWPRRAPFIRKG